jgi:hypothetical protein
MNLYRISDAIQTLTPGIHVRLMMAHVRAETYSEDMIAFVLFYFRTYCCVDCLKSYSFSGASVASPSQLPACGTLIFTIV